MGNTPEYDYFRKDLVTVVEKAGDPYAILKTLSEVCEATAKRLHEVWEGDKQGEVAAKEWERYGKAIDAFADSMVKGDDYA